MNTYDTETLYLALHRYAGRIFAPDEHELAIQRAATRRSLHAALSQYSGIDPTDEVSPEDLACNPLSCYPCSIFTRGWMPGSAAVKCVAWSIIHNGHIQLKVHRCSCGEHICITAQEFFNDLEHATKPRVHRKPLQQGGPGGVPVGALRPLLGNARMKLHAVWCSVLHSTHLGFSAASVSNTVKSLFRSMHVMRYQVIM